MEGSGDKRWQRRIQRSIDAVRAWEKRIPHPDEIERGSSLSRDDKAWPDLSASRVAWGGMTAAVDHLALGADLMKDEINLRPTSFFTVTRTALLGASQALWVLSGSREIRIGRAMQVAEDEYKQHRTYLRDYKDDPFVHEQFSAKIRGRIADDMASLTGLLDELGTARIGRPYSGRLDTTRMMREAAGILSTSGTVDDLMRLTLANEWRIASAGAHARQWPFLIRETEKEHLSGGRVLLRMSSTLKDFGMAYGAAVLMTSEAWRLWDLRRIAHLPS